MWRSNASHGTSQNSLFLAGKDWKVPEKAAKRWQLPCSELLRSFLWQSYSLPLELERSKWLSRGANALEQVPRRAGEQEAWSPQCHCRGRGGFTPCRVVALLPFNSSSPCRCSYTCLTILHKEATGATWTLSWRTVWKREFLICGKFQHSEICFSSAYKWEAKIPWSVWNGSPGEEREEGMEKIKKLPFEEKKIKILLILFWWTLPLFNFHGDQTRPLRKVSKFAAHRESERDAWKTNR